MTVGQSWERPQSASAARVASVWAKVKEFFTDGSVRRSKARRFRKSARNLFWFCVLVSWLPLAAGFENVVDQLDPRTWLDAPGRALAVPRFVPFLALLFVTTALSLFTSIRLFITCIGPSLCATYLAFQAESPAAGIASSELTAIYSASVLVSALAFIWWGHLRSSYCFAFLLLAAIEIVAGSLDYPILTFGLLFKRYTLTALDLLFLSALLVLARFVVLVIRHNWSFFSPARWKALTKDIPRAIWLWWPMLLIFVGFNWFYNNLQRHLEQATIEQITGSMPALALLPDHRPATLEEALDLFSYYNTITREQESLAKVKQAHNLGKMTADRAAKELRHTIRASFPDRLMQPSSCRWYDIFCHVMNGVKSAVNSAYRKVRDMALAQMDREIIDLNLAVTAEGQARADQVSNFVRRSANGVANSSNFAIAKFFHTMTQISWLLLIYSVMVLIKTLLVVLARVHFRDAPDNPFNLSLRQSGGSEVPETKNRALKVLGQRFLIPAGSKAFYVAPAFEVRNSVPRTAWPRPVTAIVGRVLTGRYRMGLVDPSAPGFSKATIQVNPPAELVQWVLQDDEEVVFRYRELAAFSSDVELSTEVNLSISALAFGRFLFAKAKGPGTLIFRTAGEAVVGETGAANDSRRESALKAWHVSSEFQIQSSLRIVDVFLAPFNIRKLPDDTLIYDTAPQNERFQRLGIAGSIRTFLLPF